MRRLAYVVLTAAGVIAAGCSSGNPAAPSSPVTATATASASAAATASAAQPETAAEARAVAEQFFGLYSAGQFAAAWTLLTPSAQRTVSVAAWVAVHRGCPAEAAGLAYKVGKATLTGSTAIVSVSLAGVAAGLGSVSQALVYSAGRWGLVLNDPSFYKHGSVKADIAAAKAAGDCAKG